MWGGDGGGGREVFLDGSQVGTVGKQTVGERWMRLLGRQVFWILVLFLGILWQSQLLGVVQPPWELLWFSPR